MGRALGGVQVERARRQTKVEGVKRVFIDNAGGGFVLAIVVVVVCVCVRERVGVVGV
jgi:hypothetical protein